MTRPPLPCLTPTLRGSCGPHAAGGAVGALQDTLRTVCVPLGRRGFAEPNALSLGPEKLPLRPPSPSEEQPG